MSQSNCPNCGKSLKGLFAALPTEQSKVDFINKYLDLDKSGYCTSCSKGLLTKIADEYTKQKGAIESRLMNIIHYIPVMSSPAPVKWDYDVIDLVTAQTTLGTGFATELSRSFNDFFGGTSNSSNRKIDLATRTCMADLRVQCVRRGGNAIISSDIDFNEVGSGSTNMLMVCMAGTAIKVHDMSNFRERSRDIISEIVELTEKLEAIAEMGTA